MSARSWAVLLLALLLAPFAAAPYLSAQAPQPAPAAGAAKPSAASSVLPAEISNTLMKASASLAEVEKALQHLSEMEGDLADLRAKVEAVLEETTDTADTLRPQLAAVRSQIDKLGAAPGKDAPPEAPEVAAERARLAALDAAYDGAIKTCELTWVRARQTIERITEVRHALFAKNLMERLPSPLTPGAWREIASRAASVRYQLAAWGTHWWGMARDKQSALALLLGSALVVLALLRLAFRRATNRRPLRCEGPLPTFFERAVSAFWVAALRVLPVLVAGFVLYIGLDALDLVQPNPWGRLVPATLKGVIVFTAIAALVQAVLAPSAPQWRLVPLADRPARRVTWLLGAIAGVYAADGVLTEICHTFYVPLTLTVAQSVVTSLAFAALLIGLLLTPFTPQDSDTAYPRQRPRWLKLPLWLVVLGIIATALTGYVALARFVAQQLLVTGIVALLGWLGYLAIRAFTREPTQQSRALGGLVERQFGLDEPRREQLARLTEAALTLALALCILPILLLQWGFAPADIRDWLTSLLFGFEIGQFRISLVRILAGIVLFIALLFATRLFQRWMRERAAASRIDPSIANSIETVVGYGGISLAALVAVSYAGFDITNLAIVAGALSVGIGFGLQSIVNNFVSGLILLIERPLKVGDRVVVGDQQGYVRRISVRATEIETFDRASVIVPNSELIMGRLINWSHRDWRGAASVRVAVASGCDPDQVIAILTKCAEDHPLVLPNPAPGATLESFGDSALTFNLRISLGDIDKANAVQSDLRIAILKALRDRGIKLPANQLDVTLSDLDTMRHQLGETLERPAGGPGSGQRESAGAEPKLSAVKGG
ncbi:MAG: mechanosensitive ion channel family protein [Hyphomicrobiaceae bacterium]|nr:mechanosensitive ion channel family protein [Hyphomicrobiaceae bacterium]